MALEQAPQIKAQADKKPHGFTARSVLMAIILIIGFTVAGCMSVMLRYEILGTGYLPRGVMALLLLLLLANLLWRKIRPGRGLTRQELLAIFILLAIMAGMPGQEYAQHFYLNVLAIVYYAIPEIVPPEAYLEKLPAWLVPDKNREAPVILWAYEGLPPGRSLPWRPWIVPLLVWTPFILAFYGLLLCVATLLSRRWESQERLLYPLTQVPLDLTEGQPNVSPLLRNWLLWATLGLAMIPYLTKGLHSYFPSVPDLNLQKDSGPLFGGGPLVAFNYMPLHLYPEMVGISYLLSSEVAFSLWLFYLLRLTQAALRMSLGLRTNHAQFAEMQTVGGYLVLALALLWSARHYLRAIAEDCVQGLAWLLGWRLSAHAPVEQAWRRAGGWAPEELRARPEERVAFWGLLACFALILLWARQMGLALGWAALLMGLFPLVSLVVARVVCEAGMFIYSSPFRLDQMLIRMLGVQRIGALNHTLLTMMSWTQIRGTATQFMPQAFQCLKISSLMPAPRLPTMGLLLAAVTLGLFVCHFAIPSVIYSYGVFRLGWWPQGSGLGTVNRLASELRGAIKMGGEEWLGIGLGGLTTLFLVFMRQRFLWWPFHPLGFVAWIGWPTERYWLSIFLGWIIKIAVVRFGGYQVFQRLKPAAYGLILGVCFILTFWIVFHFFIPGPDLVRE